MKFKTINHYLPPIVALFLLLVGVVAGIVLVQRPQDVRREAAAATSLSISPTSQTKSAGDAVAFSVVMNTGVNQVVGMDLKLMYDPSVLSVTSISKGQAISGFDTIIRNTVDNTNGTIVYSLFSVDKTKAVYGSDLPVLTIAATVKSTAPSGTHTITFAPETSVAAISEGQNVIASMVNGSLVISTANELNTIAPTSTSVPVATGVPTATTAPSSGGSVPPAIGKRGDLNGDGKVNVLDLSILLTQFLRGGSTGDLNGDGKVTILDLSILLSSWGK